MSEYNHLSVLGSGMALGLTSAIYMFLFGLMAWLFSYGIAMVNSIGTIYIGFKPTFTGSLIGLGYGFVVGFFGGVLIAWLYNLCSKCCHKRES